MVLPFTYVCNLSRGRRGHDCMIVGFTTMYLYNQCLWLLTLWVRIPFMLCVLDTTLCDKVCQWLAAGRWFSLGTPVSSTNKTDRNDITEILLKVALNTINPNYLSKLHPRWLPLMKNRKFLNWLFSPYFKPDST